MLYPAREPLGAGVQGQREGEDCGEAGWLLAEEGAEGVQEGEDVGWLGGAWGVEEGGEEGGDDEAVEGRWGGCG